MTHLNDELERYGKEDLTRFAKSLGLSKLSKLRKSELALKIADYLLDGEVMKHRMAVLTDAQIQLFEKALLEPLTPSEDELDDAYKLDEMDYGVITYDDRLDIPDDVKLAYKTINTPVFQSFRKKLSWLMNCLEVHNAFYGLAPVDIVYEMYQRRPKYKIGKEAMLELFQKIPFDLNPCFLLEGILIQYNYRNEEALKALTAMQRGKDFYIPTYREVIDYTKNGYLFECAAFVELRKFFMNKTGMSFEGADDCAYEIWLAADKGDGLGDMVNWLSDKGNMILDSDKDLETLIDLIQKANNSTRMLVNRGFKPSELSNNRKNSLTEHHPTIVAGSSQTADILKQIEPDINAMGFDVDIESTSTTIPVMNFPHGIDKEAVVSTRKIYPNDPCPCGSGKKYKKCCGRG